MQYSFFRLAKQAFLMLLRPWLWGPHGLSLADFSAHPIDEFSKWFNRARRCFWLEYPEAMCLSTLSTNGFPDGRLVLLKDFDQEGFVFYTNALSEKGAAIKALPRVCLTFYWEPLHRQVRIQGTVEQVSEEEADRYFSSRLRLSQIGAWASLQSQLLDKRETLEQRVTEFKHKFRSAPVPRPPHWLGYRVIPSRIEFWQLRANRLHDRFVYAKKPTGGWDLHRLYP